jgi:TolA-binding protein
MQPARRAATALAVCLALLCGSGCVYYNTFYHARQAFSEAERLRLARAPDSKPGPAELELLERAAEKSARVYDLHPESDWADDALLLLGTSLHYQNKQESAEERLAELLNLYPESELRHRAEYMMAAVMLAKRDPVSAEGVLEGLAFADPPSELSDDAMMLIGQARHSRKRYDAAAEAYSHALERFPRSDRRDEIQFLAAENYMAKGDQVLAARHYEAAAVGRTPQIALEASLRLVDLHITLGDTDAAFVVLDELQRRTLDQEPLDRIRLLKGRAYEAAGDPEEAISTYLAIAESRKRSNAASEAHFRVGVIYRDLYGDIPEAVSSFKKSRDDAPRSEDAAPANAALRDIDRLREYQKVIDEWERARASEPAGAVSPDTLEARKDPATGVADSLGGGRGDAATQRPGAGPGGDSAGGVSVEASEDELPEMMGPPPSDEIGPHAGPPLDEDDAQAASARFRLAELFLFAFGDSDEALRHYRAVLTEHPRSDLAPRAAYAVAWVLENRIGDASAAAEAYRSVVAGFPGTEFAVAAEEALLALGEVSGDRGP